jgi:hypothetical protein
VSRMQGFKLLVGVFRGIVALVLKIGISQPQLGLGGVRAKRILVFELGVVGDGLVVILFED